MRTSLSLLCLVALLVFAAPAEAQRRADLSGPAPVAVYDDASTDGLAQRLGQVMSSLFSDEHFRMSHSYEMSMSSFGGGTSLGMYTNSMQWQFNDQWAARVDMSVAHQPFGGSAFSEGDGRDMRVFLRNAEVAYRPSENMEFRFQIRQNPYGGYAGPYGYRGGAGFGSPFAHRGAFAPSVSQQGGGLFWKDHQRN